MAHLHAIWRSAAHRGRHKPVPPDNVSVRGKSSVLRRFRRVCSDNNGATAVEFGLLALPFLAVVFAILEVAFMVFIESSLDSALQRTARDVRTGTAASEGWTLDDFKAAVCDKMAFSFDCSSNLLVTTTVMTDFSSVNYGSVVSGNTLSVTESFSGGSSGSYMLIQAFLPWGSLLGFAGIDAHTLANGDYVLGASALFRNEPF